MLHPYLIRMAKCKISQQQKMTPKNCGRIGGMLVTSAPHVWMPEKIAKYAEPCQDV